MFDKLRAQKLKPLSIPILSKNHDAKDPTSPLSGQSPQDTKRERNKHFSVLDMPVSEYDELTGLPKTIQVGTFLVRPLVSIDNVRDHLTILNAFTEVFRREGANFHRLATSAAYEYERWAQTILPRRALRRATAPAAAGSSNLDAPRQRRASSSNRSPLSVSPVSTSAPSSPFTRSPPSRAATLESVVTSSSGNTTSSSAHSHHSTPRYPHHSHSLHHPTNATRTQQPPLRPAELPPLNVLMCWHAHMLNAEQYALDTDTASYESLADLVFPLADVAQAIREGSLPKELGFVRVNHRLRPTSSISGSTALDIAAMVQYQTKSVATHVERPGWLEKSVRSERGKPALQKAIVRYHAWLDLTATVDQHPFLAPTEDIELAWRTHTLRGAKYRLEMSRLMGSPVVLVRNVRGWDDSCLKRTATFWRARFKRDFYDVPTLPAPEGANGRGHR